MISIIIFILWVSFGACETFPSPHELMTLEERMEIFETTETPIYEMISITISKSHKRSANVASQRTISMRAFGENITLSCIENDGILAGKNTSTYHVFTKNRVLTIRPGKEVGDLKFYENVPAAATFTVCKLKNRQQIMGVIRSKRLAIRSLPERIAEKIIKHRRSLDIVTADESDNYQYYLAIKIPESSTFMYNNNERLKRSAVAIPKTIFPEILVIVNYWLYKKLSMKVVPYVLSFWHAVDLMYRNLVEPEIRLNIAGIVIATNEYGLSYIYTEEVIEENNVWGLNTDHSLRAMSKWLYNYRNNISLNSYDVAFTMTSNKLYGGGGDDDPINGLAYPAGACGIYEAQKMTSKVAIIQNKGAFDKITSAAHELGHLLGAEHDENDGCDDSTQMMTEDGGDRNSSDWSSCTLKAFAEYIGSNSASCLLNKPNVEGSLPIVLPGTIMNADEQCKQLGFIENCPSRKNLCMQLACRSRPPRRRCKLTRTAAATGTTCGEEKVCFRMQCVDKNQLD